jgi:branched-chain amino acid transport system substrate-binding protein
MSWCRWPAAVLWGALSVGCSSGGEGGSTTEISLGAVIDQTGNASSSTWAKAIELAQNQMNTALERSGSHARFKFWISDSTNTPAVAVQRAQELVRTHGAKGLVLDTSQDNLAVLKLQYDTDPGARLEVPLIGLVATSPSINNPNAVSPDPLVQAAYRDAEKWNFRTQIDTSPIGTVLAQIVLGKANGGDRTGDGKLKIAAFASNEAYGLGHVATLRAAFNQLKPGTVVEAIYFSPTTPVTDQAFFASSWAKLTDIHNEETGADDGPPDVLMGLTFPDYLVGMVKQYLEAKSTLPFLHGIALRSERFLNAMGGSANGQEGASCVLIDGPSGDQFSVDLRATGVFGPNLVDSSAYDAATVMMLAALKAAHGRDLSEVAGRQIRDQIFSTSDLAGAKFGAGVAELEKAVKAIAAGSPINYEGASGSVDFDAHGNVKNKLVHFIIEGGTFKDLEVYDCVSSPTCPRE